MAKGINQFVDTHQHLWVMSERAYDWISPDFGILNGDFRPEDVAEEISRAGITATVLVQAADTYDDTFYMLSVARANQNVKGVVGWVPFDRPAEAKEAIANLAQNPFIKGFRNLTHNYPDPRWILQPNCLETLKELEQRNLTLDMVSVNRDHSRAIIELADTLPNLRIVVDHMAKPNIAEKQWDDWAEDMAEVAKRPNMFVKHSGLNTASAAGWTAADWKPYVDFCVERFGSNRLMLGSDWPVSLLNGDFVGVWEAQLESIAHLSLADQENICSATAQDFYSLNLD